MNDKFVANDKITANRIMLVDSDGKMLGEYLKKDALELAYSKELDLVLVSGGDKPVCKIMNLGRAMYEQKKKMTKSKVIKLKSIQFTLQTEEDYMDTKAKQARTWLKDSNKVKLSIKIQGREMHHLPLFREKCMLFFEKIQDVANIESGPVQVGRYYEVIFVRK